MKSPHSSSVANGQSASTNADRLGSEAQAAERILVVEDDLFLGVQYEDVLGEAGFHVLDVVTTAEEAIEAVQDYRPKLAIMDIRLAGSPDGIDAAKEIHRRFGVRSIFVSAYSDAETQERAAPARPLAWLPKPVYFPRLIAAVRAAISEIDEERTGSP